MSALFLNGFFNVSFLPIECYGSPNNDDEGILFFVGQWIPYEPTTSNYYSRIRINSTFYFFKPGTGSGNIFYTYLPNTAAEAYR